MSNQQYFTVDRISIPVGAPIEEAYRIAKKRLRSLGIETSCANFSIARKSVDARKKHDIRFHISVAVSGISVSASKERLSSLGIASHVQNDLSVRYGEEELSSAPIIVGSGPAGLFAALLLAENGYRPIVLERGGNVSERIRKIQDFNKRQILDPETNIQFGAGGAGTFSDGKLITRVNDPLGNYVLRRFVDFGAPREILYLAKPHIGTDILCNVVENMINEIVRLGGEVHFHTKLEEPLLKNGRLVGARTSRGELAADALILAIGHSARDTYDSLFRSPLLIEPKSFSVGLRIEHLAADIDRAMYGDFAGHPALSHAEYALSHNTKVRGVYTFCMCPGGEVVAAASEEGGVVVNGMSEHSRAGKNSNSAVVCSIFREDYGNTPKAALDFVRGIERLAFSAGGSDYSTPLITVGDFLSKTRSLRAPTVVEPTYMNGTRYRLAHPGEYLPQFVTKGISDAILSFDTKIQGFSSPNAILCGAETRTSAPIRIVRDPKTREAFHVSGLYPAGEGAGYAGGITSAALDGIHTALAVMGRFAPLEQ